jgi:tRNA-specific 2-thiouridylase
MAMNKSLILFEVCAKLEHRPGQAVDFGNGMDQLGPMQLDPSIAEAVNASLGLAGSPAETRVVVAMSGGVDSSVVAVLLKLLGYDVVGITLQLYDHGEAIQRKGACCAGQDIHDARRVAARFDIPHYVLDYESRFRSAVIDRFVDGYLAGETPVPCISCNQTVKFADLLARAKDLGAAALATGHYIESRARGDGHRSLFTPADAARDQSYFLFATTQEQVDYLRFPLGSLAKADVRKIAEQLGLEVAAKPDSQDICFVPGGRYADVILRLRPDAAEAGDIVDMDGNVLGRHEGIIHFTIGQRKGLGVSGGEPLYVVKIDAAKKQVIAGPREALKQKRIRLASLNWLGDGEIEDGLPVHARIRSSRAPVEALIEREGEGAIVTLPAGEFGVSPGQACVLYDRPGQGARVLGGGYISQALG